MKKVLIISSSYRKDSNSHRLCQEFEKGAKEAGNQVELLKLSDYKISYCFGCGFCEKHGMCAQIDDMVDIYEKVLEADVLVLATPVYFYSMSAQLKTFIDRLVAIYLQVKSDIYILATAMDDSKGAFDSTIASIRGCTVDCFEDCPEKGILTVGGVYEAGAIEGRKELQQAYEMGKNV